MAKKHTTPPGSREAETQGVQSRTADERLLAGSGAGRAAEQRSEVERDAPPRDALHGHDF
jgi:hypothetical protein